MRYTFSRKLCIFSLFQWIPIIIFSIFEHSTGSAECKSHAFTEEDALHEQCMCYCIHSSCMCIFSKKNWYLLHSKDILYALTSNEFSPWNSQVLCIDFIIQCHTTCIIVQISVSTPISLNFASKSTSQTCFRIIRNLKIGKFKCFYINKSNWWQ